MVCLQQLWLNMEELPASYFQYFYSLKLGEHIPSLLDFLNHEKICFLFFYGRYTFKEKKSPFYISKIANILLSVNLVLCS